MRTLLIALAFAAAPASDTPSAAVLAIYAPYADPRVEPDTSWERPAFSRGDNRVDRSLAGGIARG